MAARFLRNSGSELVIVTQSVVNPMKRLSLLAALAISLSGSLALHLASADARAANPGAQGGIASDRVEPDKGEWASNAAFVVIGSFVSEDRAKRLVSEHEALKCRVLTAEVKGRTQYRVAFGPFPIEVVASALAEAARLGVDDAWLLSARSAAGMTTAGQPGTNG